MTDYTDKIASTPRSMWPDAIRAAEAALAREDLMPETRAEIEKQRDAFKQALGQKP